MKIYSLEIRFNHVIVIYKIDIVNAQLVKGNFAPRKHYHLKLSTREKQLTTLKIVFFKFSTHKVQIEARKVICLNLQIEKSNSQLTKATCNS